MNTTITLLPVFKPRVVHAPYVILAVLQVLDIGTTGWILYRFTGASEGNPVIDYIFNGVGLAIGLGILLALKLGMVYLLWMCQTGAKIALAIYTIVITNNLLALSLWLIS